MVNFIDWFFLEFTCKILQTQSLLGEGFSFVSVAGLEPPRSWNSSGVMFFLVRHSSFLPQYHRLFFCFSVGCFLHHQHTALIQSFPSALAGFQLLSFLTRFWWEPRLQKTFLIFQRDQLRPPDCFNSRFISIVKESYTSQNSLEFKLPSRSSPPFCAKQRTLSPKEKKWTLRLITPSSQPVPASGRSPEFLAPAV